MSFEQGKAVFRWLQKGEVWEMPARELKSLV